MSVDPHAHPTPAPAPASALSMYQVAHRYGMPALANSALEHMLSTLTPQTSFALLLATSAWEDLHSLVEVSFEANTVMTAILKIIQDYVVEKWEEVNVSAEFEKCCEEVSAGE